MNMGSLPTAMQARTGEFTPPGISVFAFSNKRCERDRAIVFVMNFSFLFCDLVFLLCLATELKNSDFQATWLIRNGSLRQPILRQRDSYATGLDELGVSLKIRSIACSTILGAFSPALKSRILPVESKT